jgi:hypothetical protein
MGTICRRHREDPEVLASPAAALESRFVQVGRVGTKSFGERETGWGCPMTYGDGRAASGVSATLIVG